jgi:hypothetical protein
LKDKKEEGIMITLQQKLLVPIAAAPGPGSGGGGSGGGKGGGGGGGSGGGGHTETAGNNLSFPVVFAGGSITLPGTTDPSLTVPYSTTVQYPFDFFEDGSVDASGYAFAQKVQGNSWQAGSVQAGELVNVSLINWGDSLESNDVKAGRPVRIEATLFKTLGTDGLPATLIAYPMTMLANPSSPDEIQGAGSSTLDGKSPITYESTSATVYSPQIALTLQPLVGAREDVDDDDLLWNGTKWVDNDSLDPSGVGDPITVNFGYEINVGGKLIYGLSQGGWSPPKLAPGVPYQDYRITLYALDSSVAINLRDAEVVDANPEAGGAPVVSTVNNNNLTYIDIRAINSGGGGGGGKGRSQADELMSLGAANLIPSTCDGDPLQTQFRELDRICDPVAGLFPVATSDFI